MHNLEYNRFQALRWLNSAMSQLWYRRHENPVFRLDVQAAIRNYRRAYKQEA